ncbi:MAG TPA: glycerol-3-phosphate dehydrogenase/oxidase [Burkholderiales bacterium]|nr:glycerol-3-phosphate dehydrogenase/oxidase [Burkholderiales bacterium]
MNRNALLARLARQPDWDVIVIGGGATGLGVALDAAARRYSVALVEANDFAKGTSSRTTKLVHGGVRYLAQGNLALVREGLRERANLLRNAPHLAQPLPFVMPAYRWWEKAYYGTGLVLYDVLAGRSGLGKTGFLTRDQTLQLSPTANPANLRGGVKYWDGQFDDARLAIGLARTANEHGACAVNYCKAVGLLRIAGQISGVVVEDTETSKRFEMRSRCVINATGVWVDHVRDMDGSGGAQMVAPSQGIHLVVDRSFLPGDHALLMPGTSDGRVLFAIPWLGKTLLGTTDTPRQDLEYEPRAFEEEIEFILRESARYLSKAPGRADVRSIWVGLRPLVRPFESHGGKTKAISREHTVVIAKSGLVTVTGGKWTTYRAMAEDVLEECFEHKLVKRRAAGVTAHLALIGAPEASGIAISAPSGLHLYGTDAATIAGMPGADHELAPGFTEAMVRFAVRHEFARSVEDVLARRSRLLFLDAAVAASLAAEVGRILKQELGEDFDAQRSVAEFGALAKQYQLL